MLRPRPAEVMDPKLRSETLAIKSRKLARLKALKRSANQAGKHKRTKRSQPGGTLSRERVLEEALALLDRDGFECFSMRRLAERLAVTPMALYNHVGGKQDLLQGVVHGVIEQVEYPAEREDWCERIRDCFRALRNTCIAHPGAVHTRGVCGGASRVGFPGNGDHTERAAESRFGTER